LHLPQPAAPSFTPVVTDIKDIPISRAMAAKMLALTYFSTTEIHTLEPVITFTDVPADAWHFKYVNAVYTRGLMQGAGDEFKPDTPLTFGQAYALLTAQEPGPGIAAPTDENRDKAISYALWVSLYLQFLEAASENKTIYSAFGLEGTNIIPMTAMAGRFVGDTGAFTCAGFDMGEYIDREIRIIHKNREMVALVSVLNDQPTLANMFVTNWDDNGKGVTVFSGGVERYYTLKTDKKISTDMLICDLVIEQGEVIAINPAEDFISGEIKKVTTDALELESYGVLPLDNRFKVYALIGDSFVQWKNAQHLLPGYDMADFYIKNGVIAAAVITREVKPTRIRVLLGTSEYGGLVHNGITVTADTPFTVRAGTERQTYAAGQRFIVSDIENPDLFNQPRIYIEPDEPDGLFQIIGLKRNWPDNAFPRYRGVLEIAREENGYVLINELGMEEYLYAVVPSEMPSSYGTEAGKAQAVTARSFAYNQFYENRYRAFGAHVEDSVLSQVYNNIPETKTAIEAVDATRNEHLTHNGKVVNANFYSTSGGFSANSGEVWANGKIFPAATREYLRAGVRHESVDFGDLRMEENAARFYKDKTIISYDSDIPWFRWEVYMTAEDIAASINANLPARRLAVPHLVQSESDNIGELLDIIVTRRGEAGNVMEMHIKGSLCDVNVLTEYNARVLLAPKQYRPGAEEIRLYRKDGTYVSNYGLLPSGFFVMEKDYDENEKLAGIKFFGGGNGHGVGMSQNGAKGMIDRGYGYREVLAYYYPGTEIVTNPD
jgi:stage II sporulation protein D